MGPNYRRMMPKLLAALEFRSNNGTHRPLVRERTNAGLKAALARGRKGGRRPKVKPDDVRAALALLADPETSVRGAAAKLGLSVSTLYRHAPGLRSRVGQGR